MVVSTAFVSRVGFRLWLTEAPRLKVKLGVRSRGDCWGYRLNKVPYRRARSRVQKDPLHGLMLPTTNTGTKDRLPFPGQPTIFLRGRSWALGGDQVMLCLLHTAVGFEGFGLKAWCAEYIKNPGKNPI